MNTRLTPMGQPRMDDGEAIATTPEAQRLIEQGRRWENIAFIGGVCIFLFAALVETLISACTRLDFCSEGKFEMPWIQFTVALILIMPHTLGRAQARIIVEAIADRIRGGKREEVTE